MNGTFNEKEILSIINRRLLSQPKYMINNLYVYKWESDYLAVTKSLYAYEVEVKISFEDYKKDFTKKEKHTLLLSLHQKKTITTKDSPNYFYYACPSGIIKKEDVPPYAGLIYINDRNRLEVVKIAPKLHSCKFDVVYHNLVDKFYYNMVHWKLKHSRDSKVVPEEQVKKVVREAVSKVRWSALDAYRRACPYASFPYGEDSPMCTRKEVIGSDKIVDCMMKCSEGRKFKELF